MSYQEITSKIKELRRSLELASTSDEKNYFEMELLVAEEYLERTISRGRR